MNKLSYSPLLYEDKHYLFRDENRTHCTPPFSSGQPAIFIIVWWRNALHISWYHNQFLGSLAVNIFTKLMTPWQLCSTFQTCNLLTRMCGVACPHQSTGPLKLSQHSTPPVGHVTYTKCVYSSHVTHRTPGSHSREIDPTSGQNHALIAPISLLQ